MRLTVGIGFLTLCSLLAFAGCGHGGIIGSGPLPTTSPSPVAVTTQFPAPNPNAHPGGIVNNPTDSQVYFTEPGDNAVAAFDISSSTFTTYLAKTANASPSGITIGPDADVWFTEPHANNVATISLQRVNEFSLGVAGAPALITSGPNSTLFFTEPGVNAIGSISTATDTVGGPYLIPTAGANPLGIVTGSDNNVWFTENAAAKVGRFNSTSGVVDLEIPLPVGLTAPGQLLVGPDTALWFVATSPTGPALGRLSVTTGIITDFPLTGAASATALVVGYDQNFYFLDAVNNAVGRYVVNTGVTTEFPIPTANALLNAEFPTGMTISSFDGKMYFTEAPINHIGQFFYF
jgi:virginiamycin B lyase